MPWYFRKSFGRGPFRLNLSKRGLGASFGIKGLRIGVGPRGSYVSAGRGGLYYRQYLGTGRRPNPSTPQPREMPTQQWQQKNALGLEYAAQRAGDDETAPQINERLRSFRWSNALFAAAVILGLILAGNGMAMAAFVFCLASVAGAIFLRRRETEQRRIEFSYDLDDASGHIFQTCVEAFQVTANCSAMWRVTEHAISHDVKYTAGAGSVIDRVSTRITFGDPRIVSNLPTIWIWVAGGALCVLPNRMLFFGSRGVLSLNYAEANLDARNVSFRESGPVPRDAVQIGSTWQFVNKSGSPDRRFANNRQLPILQYSDLVFVHPKLAFMLQFSRPEAAEVLHKAFGFLADLSQQARKEADGPKSLN